MSLLDAVGRRMLDRGQLPAFKSQSKNLAVQAAHLQVLLRLVAVDLPKVPEKKRKAHVKAQRKALVAKNPGAAPRALLAARIQDAVAPSVGGADHGAAAAAAEKEENTVSIQLELRDHNSVVINARLMMPKRTR